jgi:hypothetical protein
MTGVMADGVGHGGQEMCYSFVLLYFAKAQKPFIRSVFLPINIQDVGDFPPGRRRRSAAR